MDCSDANQVFDNRVLLSTSGGARNVFLSGTLRLANQADRQDASWPHTAVGGSAQERSVVWNDDISANGSLVLRLVLTKFEPPDTLRYTVRVDL